MDGYRSQPDSFQAQHVYPSAYDHPHTPREYPQSFQSQDYGSQNLEPPRPRSRGSSIAASDGPPPSVQQPLKNALNHAFEKSNSARTVDPELIAQITAEVKRSVLDEIKLNSVQPMPQNAHVPPSPISTTSHNAYNSPSPHHVDLSSQRSISPEPYSGRYSVDGMDDKPTPRQERSAPIGDAAKRTSSRPAPVRISTEEMATPIEKMWQRLFDAQGQPTPRLGQFLRGLAMHLIECYEPKKSLVVTPSKMLAFYQDVKLDDEIYPWATIFAKLPYSTLSKIYRDLRCQQHLVQEHTSDQPQIPALTPEGFQEWMTAMIHAYPETEFERLSKAVLNMPISNADDFKERFPKELPRSLLPHHENLQAQQRCAAVLSTAGVGPLRKAPTFPPPPPKTQTTQTSSDFKRERSPYSSQKDVRYVDSDEEFDEPPSVPLERERKPYSAAPGGGKVHVEDASRSVLPPEGPYEQRRRAKSTASQSQWVPPPSSAPPVQHHRTPSQVNGRRPRSPTFSSYTRPDPTVRDVPGNYYGSSFDSEEENRRYAKDPDARRKDWNGRHPDNTNGHQRRNTTTSESTRDAQPRSSYEDDQYRGRHGADGSDGRAYETRRY